MSLKFEPEDFEASGIFKEFKGVAVIASGIAQAKLDKWLSEQPVIQLHRHPNGEFHQAIDRLTETHVARLVAIEEIKPKECDHKPMRVGTFESGALLKEKCFICGVSLRAKGWEAI